MQALYLDAMRNRLAEDLIRYGAGGSLVDHSGIEPLSQTGRVADERQSAARRIVTKVPGRRIGFGGA